MVEYHMFIDEEPVIAPELSIKLKDEVIKDYLAIPNFGLTACGCMGPQENDPVCPCAMRYVITKNIDDVKRYFKVEEVREELSIKLEVTEIFST